jgi:small subunit ribosomal protein S1
MSDIPEAIGPSTDEKSSPEPNTTGVHAAGATAPSNPSGKNGSADITDRELAEALGDLSTNDLSQLTQETATDQIQPGGIHKGKVIRVTAEEVFIDLGGKTQGAVPLIEFMGQPLPKEGDAVSVIIERFDPSTGMLALSKRQADELTFWEAVKPGDELEGVVTGMNKGGLDIDIGGARAFLPASQVDVRRLKDISTLIGEHVRCVVTQVDRTTHDLIVSRRKFMEQERKEKRGQMIDALAEGEVRTGTVSNITEFGAFVDLGGVDGLLHVTDMSWARIKDPKEVVQEGQQVQVRVLKVDRQTGRISLGLKQIEPNPWDGIEAKYPEGSRVQGRVVRLADFGAFVELEPGVDALLPLSEMSWSRRIGSPAELVRVGDLPEVVVLKVDAAKRRISVGMKQKEENPWTNAPSNFAPNSTVRGKVSKLMDYGAFIELAPGVEGLIHISEISEKRIHSVGEVLKEGQEVEVRVIKLDMESQRISLSMKPVREVAAAAPTPTSTSAKKPGKKRPLRGGLSSHFEW